MQMKKSLRNSMLLLGGGIFVSGVCLKVFFATKRWDALIGFGFCAVLLVVVVKNFYGLIRGRRLFSKTIDINIPGEAIVEIPCPSNSFQGRILLFFRQSSTLYWGKVALSDLEKEFALAVLPRIEDNTRLFTHLPSRLFTK